MNALSRGRPGPLRGRMMCLLGAVTVAASAPSLLGSSAASWQSAVARAQPVSLAQPVAAVPFGPAIPPFIGPVVPPGALEPQPADAELVAEPVRLTIAAIGLDTALTRLKRDAAGAVAVPTSFDTAGWDTGGPKPGEVGPALLLGHVDSTSGPAVFFGLSRLTPGAQVVVSRADRTSAVFVVDRVESYRKARFPVARVFDGVDRPELRLITCGGSFDPIHRHYTRNIVVFAHLQDPSR